MDKIYNSVALMEELILIRILRIKFFGLSISAIHGTTTY